MRWAIACYFEKGSRLLNMPAEQKALSVLSSDAVTWNDGAQPPSRRRYQPLCLAFHVGCRLLHLWHVRSITWTPRHAARALRLGVLTRLQDMVDRTLSWAPCEDDDCVEDVALPTPSTRPLWLRRMAWRAGWAVGAATRTLHHGTIAWFHWAPLEGETDEIPTASVWEHPATPPTRRLEHAGPPTPWLPAATSGMILKLPQVERRRGDAPPSRGRALAAAGKHGRKHVAVLDSGCTFHLHNRLEDLVNV